MTTAKITYIEYDGTEHSVDAAVGGSVMNGAVDNNVPGIDADCGGSCACATCHIYVDPDWLERVGRAEASATEASMLSFAAHVADNSRLACQINVTAELDGLIVRMPEGQH